MISYFIFSSRLFAKSFIVQKGPAKEALLKDLRDRLGLKEKVKVSPGSNPKVDWHGDEGEHGTHNEAKKG